MAKNIDYSNKILQVKNLRQYFNVGHGKNKITVKAVDDVSFDIYKREVFGLVGESGSGKTTTGRSIIKLYKPTDGEVIFDGNVIGKGFGGNVHNIKKAKRQYKLEMINADPAKEKKYVLKQKYLYKVSDINAKISVLEAEMAHKVAEIKLPIQEHETLLENNKYKYLLELDDEVFTQQSKLNDLLFSEIDSIYAYEEKYVKTSKNRMKSKLSFAKSLKETKEEVIQEVQNAYVKEISNVQTETYEALKEISEYEALRYAISRGISKNEDDKVKLKELESKVVKADDHKEAIKEFKSNRKKAVALIKEKYAKTLEVAKSNAPDYKKIKSDTEVINRVYADKIKALKEEIRAAKAELKAAYKKVDEDKKANPSLYVVNKEAMMTSKEKYTTYKAEQKELIKKAKYQNKFKEFKEDKKIRLAKQKALKDEFASSKAQATSQEAINELTKEFNKKYEEVQNTKPDYGRMVLPMQMIFQDPISSLNPRMIVKDIIAESLYIQGITNPYIINERVSNVLKQVGLSPDHATRYPHEFSGGQRQRIGIARALVTDTKFIIADEPVSALDVSIQAQVINLLNDLKESLDLTILFIAHDLSVVKYFSDRIAVMFSGKIVELSNSDELFKHPLHPYTKSLLSAIPHPDPDTERTRKRVKYNPDVHNYVTDKPKMVEITDGHFIYANDEELAAYKKELGIK